MNFLGQFLLKFHLGTRVFYTLVHLENIPMCHSWLPYSFWSPHTVFFIQLVVTHKTCKTRPAHFRRCSRYLQENRIWRADTRTDWKKLSVRCAWYLLNAIGAQRVKCDCAHSGHRFSKFCRSDLTRHKADSKAKCSTSSGLASLLTAKTCLSCWKKEKHLRPGIDSFSQPFQVLMLYLAGPIRVFQKLAVSF